MNDGYCPACGEAFHLDDCGGYNPPCNGCGLCTRCCESNARDDDADDFPEPETSVGGGAPATTQEGA